MNLTDYLDWEGIGSSKEMIREANKIGYYKLIVKDGVMSEVFLKYFEGLLAQATRRKESTLLMMVMCIRHKIAKGRS